MFGSVDVCQQEYSENSEQISMKLCRCIGRGPRGSD